MASPQQVTVRLRSVVLEAGTIDLDRDERRHRLAPPASEAATVFDRIAAAFQALPLSEIEARIVGALVARPGSSSAQLSSACGWSRPIWHTHVNLMCQRRRAWLGAVAGEGAAAFPAAILVEYASDTGSFTLRPEAARVFADLGVAAC